MDLTGPATWEVDAVLSDGHTVHLRSIRPEDAGLVESFHGRQSAESVYFRFFSPRPHLSERELRHFTTVDHRDRVAFVAVLDGELIGVARYERYEGTDTAEIAFFVDDRHHGRGLATLMLEYLAAAARGNGIGRFRATTLPNNRRMLRVFAAAGYDVATHLEDGVVEVAFDLDSTRDVQAALQRREHQAEVASARRLLQPGRIAIVDIGGVDDDADGADQADDADGADGAGGSTAWGVPGALDVARTLSATGYTGDVVTVAADRLDELAEGTDLVIVSGPARRVPAVLEACGRAAVGAVVVLSKAGPGQVGAMLEVARRHGLRLLGPGSFGVSNTDPDIRMHAMADGPVPPAGSIGMLAESGDVVTAIVDHAVRVGLGLSTLVSVDVPADLNVVDMLSYWADDPTTRAVLLYLGPHALPGRFVRAARSATMTKPVVALHASQGPTDPRRELERRRDEAVIRQSGVIAVSTLQELFAIGRLLADQPAPSGRRVAVIGSSDGGVGLAAAACSAAGLDPDVRVALHGDAELVLVEVAADPALDALIVVDTTPGPDLPPRLGARILEVCARHPDLTVAAVTVGGERPVRIVDPAGAVAVPVFTFPEHAANAIARLAAAREWRSTARIYGSGTLRRVDPDAARRIADRSRSGPADGSATVAIDDRTQEELLAAFGVDVAPRRTVLSVEDAVTAARGIGWPIVLKARHRDRSRRTALGGVALDIAGEDELRATWNRMEDAIGRDSMSPAVVQRLVERGVDIGVRFQRSGSLTTVEIGLGGPAAAFDPWELGVLPLNLADAGLLVSSSSIGRALTDPIERVPVVALLHRLAALVDSVDEIRSLRADPVIVSGPDAWITDIEILLGEPAGDPLIRRLD